MNEETLQNLLNTAVRQATEQTRTEFQGIIDELNRKITALQPTSRVQEYKDIEIVDGVICEESLDIVKSVPEFRGETSKYISWRQAAVTAHKLFERFEGSSKYYQAVAILRNKIVGKADAVLSTYSTVLNFHAILARLDFAYADKTSIFALEQQLSTLKQGNRPIINFYNDVESKLTSIINKVIMSHEGDAALIQSLNQKYRMDALRVFISGLQKPLCDTLFSCKPTDLPTALALAQELETNQNRYNFATIYSNGLNRLHQDQFAQTYQGNATFNATNTINQTYGNHLKNFEKNLPFNSQMQQPLKQAQRYFPQYRQNSQANVLPPNTQGLGFQPRSLTLDTDVSMRTIRSNNFQGSRGLKGDYNLSKQNMKKMQELNHLNHEVEKNSDTPCNYNEYQNFQNISFEDEINFLRGSSFLPYIEKSIGGENIRLLVDTGSTKSYIKNVKNLKGIKKLSKPFLVKSVHGASKIDHATLVNLFGKTEIFFLLQNLPMFDGILGFNFLKQINGVIDAGKDILVFDGGQEKLNYLNLDTLNNLEFQSIPSDVKKKFYDVISKNAAVFANPNEALPYNTNIVATIRTKDEEPVYCRYQAYPISMIEFVNEEVKKLLKDGIIRPSRSPYNSPIWVVDKKGTDEQGRPNKRLVIDFTKLNSKTICDKYPIPDPSIILSNLGKAKFFTTLDLKSGFHQIKLIERDREKTAFNVNNGKYEFCRLPFGLKNAPSIFQRAIDDILREEIGKTCHVYIDDIIIFSESEEKHINDIDTILKKLLKANMRVSLEKSKFFKNSVEYLGFIVSTEGIKTCPSKIKAIIDYKTPTTLRALRSFLGLSGYYRRFVKDYAAIAKPLTKYLRGENGHIGTRQSKLVKIELDDEALAAFEKLKKLLASEDVLLLYPDFEKPFDLTTDASSHAIGAVLSQNGRPITMISRTLSPTEENYATNERELLAIVWALKTLRHYLYGVKNLNIITDHQPLIFSVSDKNPNSKIKRWKSFIEEYSPTFFYKPGKDNVVADALSRQFINLSTDTTSSISLQACGSEISSTEVITTVENPINCFRNQIILEPADHVKKETKIIFKNRIRHKISYKTAKDAINSIQTVINPGVVNAIHCDLPILAQIQHFLISNFPSVKFRYTKKIVTDIFNPNDQLEILNNEHNRAHRSLKENIQQILQDYYFPDMRKQLKHIISTCKTCLEAKYSRHPRRHQIVETPIPSSTGEILHIDIYNTNKQFFLTCLDKFSKFAVVKPIASRAIIDIKPALLEILNLFGNTRIIVCDNEKSLNSITIKTLVKNNFNADIHPIPPLHSSSNGQVERFHSTLTEIARCLKLDGISTDSIDLILLATSKYNRTIHSTTGMRPIDIIKTIPEDLRKKVYLKIKTKQESDMTYHNKNTHNKKYNPGDIVYVKVNKRLGNKFSKIFVEKVVEKDLGTTLKIDGKIVHKDNIR